MSFDDHAVDRRQQPINSLSDYQALPNRGRSPCEVRGKSEKACVLQRQMQIGLFIGLLVGWMLEEWKSW
jgi:hypothetical protein